MERRYVVPTIAAGFAGLVGLNWAVSTCNPTTEFGSLKDVPMDKFYPELKSLKPTATGRITTAQMNLIWANYTSLNFNADVTKAVLEYWAGLTEKFTSVTVKLGREQQEVLLKRAPYKQGGLFMVGQDHPHPAWDKPGYIAGTKPDKFTEGFASYVKIPSIEGRVAGFPFLNRRINALFGVAVETCHVTIKPEARQRTLSQIEQLVAQEIVGNSFGQAMAYAADITPYPIYLRDLSLNSLIGRYRMNPQTPVELFTLKEEIYKELLAIPALTS